MLICPVDVLDAGLGNDGATQRIESLQKVSAEFKDGILTVHVPKDEKAKRRSD